MFRHKYITGFPQKHPLVGDCLANIQQCFEKSNSLEKKSGRLGFWTPPFHLVHCSPMRPD